MRNSFYRSENVDDLGPYCHPSIDDFAYTFAGIILGLGLMFCIFLIRRIFVNKR